MWRVRVRMHPPTRLESVNGKKCVSVASFWVLHCKISLARRPTLGTGRDAEQLWTNCFTKQPLLKTLLRHSDCLTAFVFQVTAKLILARLFYLTLNALNNKNSFVLHIFGEIGHMGGQYTSRKRSETKPTLFLWIYIQFLFSSENSSLLSSPVARGAYDCLLLLVLGTVCWLSAGTLLESDRSLLKPAE